MNHNDHAECPWCEDLIDDLLASFDPDLTEEDEGPREIKCPECGKPVVVTREIEIHYAVRRPRQ